MSLFEEAARFVTSVQCDNDTKLRLYSLYKLATETQLGPAGKRPGMFDFVGRAKYDAYKALAESEAFRDLDVSQRQEKARHLYTEEARKLGLGGSSDSSQRHRKHVNTGMVSVSTMADEDEAGPAGDESEVHLAALDDDAVRLETLLAGQSQRVDEMDSYGYSALHLACDRGHLNAARVLVAHGASVALRDPDGHTALDLAKEAEQPELVALLEGDTV